MTRIELESAVAAAKLETREALHTIYDAMNHGQQKQLVKEETVKALFELYEVAYDE